MKTKELFSMEDATLTSKLSELKKDLIKQRAQVATGTTPKNPRQIKNIKRTIARILTIIRQRETEKSRKAAIRKIKTAKEKK